MIETLDAGLIFNTVITAALGLAIHFVKSWKAELTSQLSELYDDIKKLREDIFSLSLKEESTKGTYYNIFAKSDEIHSIKQEIDSMKERVITLEVINQATLANRRKGDSQYVAVVSPTA